MSNKQKRFKRPRDRNIHATSTVAIATGGFEESSSEVEEVPESTSEERHAAAVTLGRKGGKTRAEKLTPEQRREIARKAARSRWERRPQA